jgi:arsenite methyltransferase
MAERVFARKMERVGFEDVWIGEHTGYGIDQASLYPLFTDDIIELMRRLIPEQRHGSVAIGVIATARKPAPD